MADIRKIYKYALFLPMLVPLIFAPLLYFGLQSLGEKLGLIVIIVFYSGIIGGIPYLFLGVALAIWMQNKAEAQIRKALMLSPLIMSALTAVLLFALWMAPIGNRMNWLHSLEGFFGALGVLMLFIGIFGYSYVGIAFGLARLVRGFPFGSFPK
ncbi:MAG: hypothetical protein ABL984_14665 [Pyrinomonadaceae bacterium]